MLAQTPHIALVSRPTPRAADRADYLILSPEGSASWTTEPDGATVFGSMREATRAAMRLPAALRAFSLPRDVEMTLRAA